MVTLSDEDRAKIANTVAAAEAQTSGEICCVLTDEVSHYREVPFVWAAVIALLLPPLLLAFGFRPLDLADTVSGWAAAQGNSAARDILLALGAYALLQAALFAGVALASSVPAVRRLLTPRFVKRRRMQLSARKYFSSLAAKANDVAVVLIYASRFDRMVEIVVSEAVAKACDSTAWKDAAAAVGQAMRDGKAADGFVRAIGRCGEELATHFTGSPGSRPNRLPDTLLES